MSDDNRSIHAKGGRAGDAFYRDRWSHDKVVRSTHGVNCTGSCSWKVYVKDGIITWEAQQTDYPSTGADRPEYEPRGCPRGAAFSWYTYSPTRVRFPYVRGVLLEMFREARRAVGGDPVLAWASIVQDPDQGPSLQVGPWEGRAGPLDLGGGRGHRRGRPRLHREALGPRPDRRLLADPRDVAGLLRLRALVSWSSSAAPMLSFYDWYADLPNASPQMFGDQTDVPSRATGGMPATSSCGVERARSPARPDAHWMTEARYRGPEGRRRLPDYAENVKFADEWVAAAPGTDGALAMAMGHVILKEFFVDQQVDFFTGYNQRYTDLPFLVALEPIRRRARRRVAARLPSRQVPRGRRLDIPESTSENAMWKPAVLDARTGEVAVPNGSIGFRYGGEGWGRWNLDLGDIDPAAHPARHGDRDRRVVLPRFDSLDGKVAHVRGASRGAASAAAWSPPSRPHAGAVRRAREGLPGDVADGYDDPRPRTRPPGRRRSPRVPAEQVVRLAREWAQNADRHRAAAA